MATPTETIAIAKAWKLLEVGKAYTFREIQTLVHEAQEADTYIPDEDGQEALLRHLEGGWHRGMLQDEPWWAQ